MNKVVEEIQNLKVMQPKADMPSVDLIKSLLSYDAETGVIVWIGPASRNNLRKRGDIQGTREKGGHLHIRLGEEYFGRRNIYSHRIAWALHYGQWPAEDIDHINGDKADNRISNLRQCTRRQNKYNSKVRADSGVGLKGVTRRRRKHLPYSAQIVAQGVRYYLGSFATAEEAHAAYGEAAKRLHGRFARLA